MKSLFLYVLLLVNAVTYCLAQDNSNRFMIIVNGKAGYLDEKGKVVIAPQFLAAGEFFNGLAAVRVKGSYGYINTEGKFVIPAQYDYALGFREGLAQVYIDKDKFFIDSTGKKVFEANYKKIDAFKNGRAVVTTESGAQGYIDTKGNLFIDTLYRYSKSFYKGRSVVFANYYELDTPRGKIKGAEITGVIDTLGHLIIPFGKYQGIGNFEEGGYARASLFPTEQEKFDKVNPQVLIDSLGNVVWTRREKYKRMRDPQNGLVRLQAYGDKDRSIENKPNLEYVNLKGESIFASTDYNEGTDFSNNRAFVKHNEGGYSLIDSKGKFIKELFCEEILLQGFQNGRAFVKVKDKWGQIDTNGTFLIRPAFDGIYNYNHWEDYFFFTEKISGDQHGRLVYGVAGADGKVWIKAIMNDFDRSGYHSGLLKCTVDKKLTYFDRQGKVVWQQTEAERKKFGPMNIDCQLDYYFQTDAKQQGIKDASLFPHEVVGLFVRTDVIDTIFVAGKAYSVYLFNRTAHPYKFITTGGTPSLSLEAMDKNGRWRRLEYIYEGAICGTGMNQDTLVLRSDQCVKYRVPVFEGDFKTKFRVALMIKYDPLDPVVFYSNTFSGSMNSAQFWRNEEKEYLRDILSHRTLLPKSFYKLYEY